jgi:hypothetical protein
LVDRSSWRIALLGGSLFLVDRSFWWIALASRADRCQVTCHRCGDRYGKLEGVQTGAG